MQKKKENQKKLVLHRETLQALALRLAQGGSNGYECHGDSEGCSGDNKMNTVCICTI